MSVFLGHRHPGVFQIGYALELRRPWLGVFERRPLLQA